MTQNLRHHRLEGRRVYRLTGSDGRDLLQRISTADLTSLSEDRPVATLLTNEKGRVVDLVGVATESDGSLLVAGIGDSDGRVRGWLDRFIIMEDVMVTDVSEQYASIVLYAKGTDGVWSFPEVPVSPLVPIAMGRSMCGLAVMPSGTTGNLAAFSSGMGTSVDAVTFLEDRIAAGVPWPGTEVGEHRHPLEARLRSLVSFTKGCYIGQEVIARLDAYRKVQMALTRFTGSIGPGDHVPIALTAADGTEAGLLTSAGGSSSLVCGLGFVRVSHLQGTPALRSPKGTTVAPLDTDPSDHIYA